MKSRKPVIEVIEDDLADVLRRMSGAQKLRCLDSMFRSIAGMIRCSIREAHPDWSPEQVSRETSKRIARDSDAAPDPEAPPELAHSLTSA
jgi:hypothetical protein